MTTIRPIPDDPWAGFPEVSGQAEQWDSFEEVPDSAMQPLRGGAGATMSPAVDDGQGLARVWQEAGRKLKEAIFGHPDRAEAEAAGVSMQPTPAKMLETALVGAAAMGGGGAAGAATTRGASMAGRVLRNPLTRSIAAGEAARRVGEVAEDYGAPRGTAAVVGTAGALMGGRSRGRSAPARGDAQPASLGSDGPRTLHVPEGMGGRLPGQGSRGGNVVQMPTAPSVAQAQADEMAAKITSLREKGLSGAQITSSLRQLYPGYRPSEYGAMVKLVLEGAQ